MGVPVSGGGHGLAVRHRCAASRWKEVERMWFKSSFANRAVAAISFCLIGGTVSAPAYADLGDQLDRLLANDGAAHEPRSIEGEQL